MQVLLKTEVNLNEEKIVNQSGLNRNFVLSYAGFWLCWGGLHALVLNLAGASWPESLADAIISNILLAAAGILILNTYRFSAPGSSNYLYRFAYIATLSILCLGSFNWIMKQLVHYQPLHGKLLDGTMPVRLVIDFLLISLIEVYSGMRYYMMEQEENKKRKTDAELYLRDAELSKLRQQLQPHFLFNSLNSISALSVSQPLQARKMIEQLSDFLRGTLKKDDQQLIEFIEELKHLELYLEIEKVRFGHRMLSEILIADECKHMQLPSLLLQPVVENAIKYGLYDTTEAITIRIRAEFRNGNLVIRVENPFDATRTMKTHGTGLGLGLVQRRLWLLYARNDLLKIIKQDNLFITELQIPQYE